MLLYLIRHGETDWNRQKRYFGATDIKLNPTGIRQAKSLSRKFRKIRVDRVYSSGSKRAHDFAKLVFPGRRINKNPGLREMDFGIFEGKTHAQLMRDAPAIYGRWLKNPYDFHIPEGAKPRDFRERVLKALAGIIRRNKGNAAAVVAHAGPIMMIMSGIFGGRDIDAAIPKLAGVNVLKFMKGKASRVLFNGEP